MLYFSSSHFCRNLTRFTIRPHAPSLCYTVGCSPSYQSPLLTLTHSVNLGVLICIECSGIHRSLGVYISQVRSLTLDTLKSEWVTRLKTVGNTRSNEVYEETLPKDFDRETLKKKEDWRQEFITDKYVNMKYTSQKNRERILQESEPLS